MLDDLDNVGKVAWTVWTKVAQMQAKDVTNRMVVIMLFFLLQVQFKFP